MREITDAGERDRAPRDWNLVRGMLADIGVKSTQKRDIKRAQQIARELKT